METIYLDHNATTPIHPQVAQAMAECHARGYANPASGHGPGRRARKALEDARQRIAAILGADLSGSRPDRLVFTGSATQANNLAVLGIGGAGRAEPGQVIVSALEHASVIEPAEELIEQGWDYDGLPASAQGVVQTEFLPGLLTERTRLVSVTLGNHETGVLQPVAKLAEMCQRAVVPMHTDAAQVVGKLPVDFRRLGVGAMTLSAHKFRGPPGIGALLLRHDVAVEPLLFGGPHQGGLWPGTEPVALPLGMLTALELWQRDHRQEADRLAGLRERFESGLKAGAAEVIAHGADAQRLPQTSNLAFPGVDARAMLPALDRAGVACSLGSACGDGSAELSPTLRAMGLPMDIVRSSLRFSLGATTSLDDIDEAVRRVLGVYERLRGGRASARP